jgi:flavodoxin I
MRTALIYGSSTGNTEGVAESLRDAWGHDQITDFLNVADLQPQDLLGYELIIAGIPTWYSGELQDDWIALHGQLEDIDLSDTRIAVFGLGDAYGYPLNFLDGAGIIYEKLTSLGAQGGFGFWPTEDYEFEESLAKVNDNQFCALAIDEDNESELTETRIQRWVTQVRSELQLA